MTKRRSPVAALTALAALSTSALLACSGGGMTGSTDTGGDDVADGTEEGDAADSATPDAAEDTTVAQDTSVSPDNPAVMTLMDEQTVTLADGRSAPITVDVPQGVSSVTISVLGGSDGMYGLASWAGPDDTVLVQDGWLDGGAAMQGLCLDCPNRIALSEGDFAAIAPNNPEPTLLPGPHTFVAFGMLPKPVSQNFQGPCGDDECTILDQFQCPKDCEATPVDGDVKISVYAKVLAAEPAPASGVLNLNLHFTGAKGWTAETAPDDEELQAILDQVRVIYGQDAVKIRLGEITYRDVDPDFHIIETVQGPDSDLMRLFAQSEGAPADAVNLFFVDEISAGQFGGAGVILGVSGGIPGPPLAPGTWRSGVAISVKEVEGAPAGIDTTVAHETGHFLGLFHTSEQNFGFGAQVHDPLPDTPQNDETYLMFYTGAGDTLSEWQGRVMRSNPFVRYDAEDMQ